MKRVLVAVLLSVPLAAAAQQPPPYGYGPVRSPWYIGFGIGAGDGQTYVGGNTSSFHDVLATSGSDDHFRLALNFKVGATMSPKTLLGFDLTLLRAFGSVPGAYDTWVQVANLDLMFSYFPMEQGLFLRGGGGFSHLQTGARDPYTAAEATNDYGGLNLLGGVGYAFWLGSRFNLTLNADLSWQVYPWSTAVKGSRIFLAYVGFDFY